MSERAALITASDKTYVPELAEALHDHGYEIISLGETAKRIESKTEVEVIRTEAFLKAAGIHIDQSWVDTDAEEESETLPSRARREIVASHLSQCLALRRDRLEKLGWPAIDFAYVNLMMPDSEKDEERNY